MRKFVRDVCVRVVARLVAALLLYLIGRAVGILPEYRDQVANVMVLIGVGGVVLWISTYFLPEERSPRRSVMLGIAMAMLGISLSSALVVPESFPDDFDRIMSSVGGPMAVCAGLLVAIMSWRTRPRVRSIGIGDEPAGSGTALEVATY